MNLEIVDLETRKAVAGIINGQIKGDTLVGRARDFMPGRRGKKAKGARGGRLPRRQAGKYAGLDIVVAQGGVTQQFGLEGASAMLSLDPKRAKAGQARVDKQSFSAFSYLFEDAGLVQSTLDDAQAMRSHILETGGLPVAYMDSLRELADSELPLEEMSRMSPVEQAAMINEQDEARRILEFIDAGYDPRKSPNILNMILESKEKQLAKSLDIHWLVFFFPMQLTVM
jgi:hypothetical protein